ncbi:hypothetical protein ABIE69_001293 [Rhodobacteraceae bacterium MBR-64]|jgi:hypothetical protein
MPQVIIVYWRDIPAQVIVGRGRGASKIALAERFEQAIDRCAMRSGARDADAYMADWRKAAPTEIAGEPTEVAKSVAAGIEADYDTQKLRALIDSDGWAASPPNQTPPTEAPQGPEEEE